MNEYPPKSDPPNNSEEVDLGQLFNGIGNAFSRLINFIASIFIAIFSVIIYTLKAIIVNIKIIVIVMLLAGILGCVLERSRPAVYSSSMLVRPYFDSKFQFVTNMGYYNALLGNHNYETIAELFEISEEEATEILGFEIEPGPETENDKIVEYHKFLQTLDSTRRDDVSYKQFIENRSIYSGDLFKISVLSYQDNIFTKLEGGVNRAFSNDFSIKKKQKRDSLLTIQKNNIATQLSQVDSLQKVYIRVLESDSKSKSNEISLGGESFSLGKDRGNTREYDLLEKEISLRNQLKELQEKRVDQDVFFDVISNFQKIGEKTKKWDEKYSLIFPIIAFILLCLIYATRRIVKYVKNYDA